MSKGELLYFKGMQEPESEESDDEDIWDDSKLTAAYDKAVAMANAEIARRVAMSTNNRSKTESKKEITDDSKIPKSKAKSSKHTDLPSNKDVGSAVKWKAGMACSAVYDLDGLEYEAFILRIINDDECVVRFLGYENSEVVAIRSLKPSLGKEVRAKQIQEALDFNGDTQLPHEPEMMKNEDMDVESDKTHSVVSDGSHHTKRKSKKKKHKGNRSGFESPRDLPTGFTMPAIFMNGGIPEMPIPPPPPTLLGGAAASEDQALSSMLLSWYMSGYCTGYYQGITRSKESKRKH